MRKKQLIIETTEGEEDFEVDEIGKRFYVFKLLTNVKGSGQSKKIGDAVSWNAAVELAKVFTGKPVVDIKAKES